MTKLELIPEEGSINSWYLREYGDFKPDGYRDIGRFILYSTEHDPRIIVKAFESAPLRPTVAAFAVAMETKLQAKDEEKGGWDDVVIEWLFLYLEDELRELRDALIERDPRAIFEEAIDVGNLAMMIADKAAGQGLGILRERI